MPAENLSEEGEDVTDWWPGLLGLMA
jgi:hypothetical protein